MIKNIFKSGTNVVVCDTTFMVDYVVCTHTSVLTHDETNTLATHFFPGIVIGNFSVKTEQPAQHTQFT